MPYDSEGNFTRVHNWEEDRQNDIDIMSDRMDEEFDNYADGLNDVMLRDGRCVMAGNLRMGNYQIKQLANGTATTDAVNVGQLNNFKNTILNGNNVFSGTNSFTGALTINSSITSTTNNTFSGNNDFTGQVTVPTQALTDKSTKVATTAYVWDLILKKMTPNYAGQEKHTGGSFTVPSDGWVYTQAFTNNGQTATFSISGKEVWRHYSVGDRSAVDTSVSGIYFVRQGTVCTANGCEFIGFYPMLG